MIVNVKLSSAESAIFGSLLTVASIMKQCEPASVAGPFGMSTVTSTVSLSPDSNWTWAGSTVASNVSDSQSESELISS